MNLFVLFFVVLAVVVLMLVLLGRLAPGSGASLLEWDSGRSAREQWADDAEDLSQLVGVLNRSSVERGLPKLSDEEIRRAVAEGHDPLDP
jgi:hypothetical protein